MTDAAALKDMPKMWPAGSPAAEAWRAAGDDFARRLDAERLRGLRPGGFDFETLNRIALDDDNLAHVLAELGFEIVDELPMKDTAPAGALHPRLRCGAGWWPGPFGPVRIASGEGVGTIAIDLGSGAWRALPLGGARGLDLIELVAHRLGLSRWQAAVRLARWCGLPAVPEVPAR